MENSPRHHSDRKAFLTSPDAEHFGPSILRSESSSALLSQSRTSSSKPSTQPLFFFFFFSSPDHHHCHLTKHEEDFDLLPRSLPHLFLFGTIVLDSSFLPVSAVYTDRRLYVCRQPCGRLRMRLQSTRKRRGPERA